MTIHAFLPSPKSRQTSAASPSPSLLSNSRAGVKRHNLKLIAAIAIHRKWTTRELATILGDKIAYGFGHSQLYNHDAEDPDELVHMGITERGQEAEINRAVLEAVSERRILWGQRAYALRHLSRVFMAGAQDEDVARRLAFELFPTVEAAIAEAGATLGKDCSIVYQHRPPEYTPQIL